MPGVLMIESLTQVATLLLFGSGGPPDRCAWLRGVDNAKFRRQVVPGDRLELEVTMGRRRGRIVRAAAVASVDGQVVAEAELVIVIEPRGRARRRDDGAPLDPSRRRSSIPTRRIGEGTIIGPYATIGPHVAIGRNCRIGASSVVDGWTEIGDHTRDLRRSRRSASRRRT